MAEPELVARYDERILPSQARYEILKGAQHLRMKRESNSQNSQSQISFAPAMSEVDWLGRSPYIDVGVQFALPVTRTTSGGNPIADIPVVVDKSLAARPIIFQRLMGVIESTLNANTTTMQFAELQKELNLMTLTDSDNRYRENTSTVPDVYYLSYDDANGANNNPMNGYKDATLIPGTMGNSALKMVFLNRNGEELVGNGNFQATDPAGGADYQQNYKRGIPVTNANQQEYTIYVRFDVQEYIRCPPFVWNSKLEDSSTGLRGVISWQQRFNVRQGADAKAVCNSNISGGTEQTALQAAGAKLHLGNRSSPFYNPELRYETFAPSLDIPLPNNNVTRYMEFDPRNQVITKDLASEATTTIRSETLNLGQIFDLGMFSVGPRLETIDHKQAYYGLQINEMRVRIGSRSPELTDFNNYDLFRISRHNGLDIPYSAFRGFTYIQPSAGTALTDGAGQAYLVPTAGSMVVLRPGRDITLPEGWASGLGIQLQWEVELDVFNQGPALSSGDWEFRQVFAYSGFYEIANRQATINTGFLSQEQIVSQQLSRLPEMELDRMVGGAGNSKNMMDKLGAKLGPLLAKGKDVAEAAAKGALKGARKSLKSR